MKVTKPNELQISSLRRHSFDAKSELLASSLSLIWSNLCFLYAMSLLLKYTYWTPFRVESKTISESILPAFSVLSEIPKIFFAIFLKRIYPKGLNLSLYLKNPRSLFGITRPGAHVITEILLEDISNLFESSFANNILHNLLFYKIYQH